MRSAMALGSAAALLLVGCGHTALTKQAVAPSGSGSPSATVLTPSSLAARPTLQAAVSTTVAAAPAGVMRCGAEMLRIGYGDQVSPATGEHAVMYSLTNTSRRRCWMRGYPAVSLHDRDGKTLPFRYTRERSQYVTTAAPRTVLVPPQASAYFLVAKYRCDVGTQADATRIEVTPPGNTRQLSAPAAPSAGSGVYTLSYCKGGVRDPGQTVAVTPVEAAPMDALPDR
jgi:hypothetical protein